MENLLKWEYAGHYFPEIFSEVLVTLAIVLAVALIGILLRPVLVWIDKKLEHNNATMKKPQKAGAIAAVEDVREASVMTTAVD